MKKKKLSVTLLRIEDDGLYELGMEGVRHLFMVHCKLSEENTPRTLPMHGQDELDVMVKFRKLMEGMEIEVVNPD